MKRLEKTGKLYVVLIASLILLAMIAAAILRNSVKVNTIFGFANPIEIQVDELGVCSSESISLLSRQLNVDEIGRLGTFYICGSFHGSGPAELSIYVFGEQEAFPLYSSPVGIIYNPGEFFLQVNSKEFEPGGYEISVYLARELLASTKFTVTHR